MESDRQRLPQLPPFVRMPPDDTVAKFDDPRLKPKVCFLCHGTKVFRWYGSVDSRDRDTITEWDCDCPGQRTLVYWFFQRGIPWYGQQLGVPDIAGIHNDVMAWVGRYATSADDQFRFGWGGILRGGSGSGKTLATLLLLKELLAQGKSGYFLKAAEVMRLSNEWRDPQVKEHWKRVVLPTAFLVIDDLGKETGNMDWIKTRIEEVVRWRSEQVLPTIITTSLADHDLATRYGPYTLDMVRERGDIIHCPGGNWRTNSRERSLQEMRDGLSRPMVFR